MSEAFNWEPLSLDDAVALMYGFPAPWWIGGGWAIDIFADRITREHEDVDVVVRASNQLLLRRQLPSWDLQVAHRGRLTPWVDPITPLEGSLWARSDPAGPWQVQFLLAAHDGDEWVFRHDESIRLPLADAILRSPDGIPYLRPELVLLNKSRRPRERDELDFATVLPLVDDLARERLRAWLPRQHVWRARL